MDSIPSFGPAATPLYHASLAGHKDVVIVLLDRGAGVEMPERQAVFAAALNGHLDILQLLINKVLIVS